MKRFDTPRMLPWLVLVVGLCLTFLAWHVAKLDSDKQLREEFESRVNLISGRIENRVQDSEQILRGTAGLFNASHLLSRNAFKTYVESQQLEENYPGIQGIGFGLLLPAADKAAFLAQIRKQGAPQYTIWPAGERDWYAPVIYLEPSSRTNQTALGYDMHSEQERRHTLERARDEGKITMTGKLNLVIDREHHAGLLMFAPVYRHDAPRETLAERRDNLIGWVYMSFRMNDMMQGILGDSLGDIRTRLAFTIFDGETTPPGALLYSSHALDTQSGEAVDALFHTKKTILLAGQHWTLVAHSLPGFGSYLLDQRSIGIIVVGCIGSALLALLVWQLISGRKRAVLIARRMNRDLIEREKRYRQMFEDNASMAYLIDPTTGHIVDANSATAHFWGYSLTELRGMNVADINIAPLARILEQFGSISTRSSIPFHFRHRLKNGEVRDVEVFANPLRYQDRTCIYSIMHDITDRKRAENALRHNQERLRAIIDTTMDSVAQIDSNGFIIDWNTPAEKTFGWSRQEAIGRRLIDTIIPARLHDEYRSGLRQFLESEDSLVRHSQFEIVGQHRDHYEFPIEVAITTMVGHDKRPEFCAFIHDISNRKRNENALRKARNELENRVFERTAELVRSNKRLNSEIAERTEAQEALQQSQEMLRELVAHQDRIRETERKRIAREIHDELGQHLLVLRIDVSMLTRDSGETTKLRQQVDAILQHIDTTMKSVRTIINNLRPSVLDLGLFAALEWQAGEFQRRSGIECELLAEDENLELDDNTATVLFRILQEGLNNVLKHARASRIQIDLHREKDRLVMKVADNGIGIPKKRSREQKSFGLAGIRERLGILGGTLHIDSSSNGTVLIVSLPLPEELAS